MGTTAPTTSHAFGVAGDHPVFAGHFPGQPVLPGVMLLAEVMRGVRRSPRWIECLGDCPEIVSAKFLAPLRPGQCAELHLHAEGRGARFEIRVGEQLAASGQLRRGSLR